MFYCSECSNIYDITKDPTQIISVQQTKENTSSELSSMSSSDSDNKNVPIEEPKEKQNIQRQKSGQNERENPNQMYFICHECQNYESIKPGTRILTKTSIDVSKEYRNSKLKPDYLINITTLPRTRNYICPNKECVSHSDLSKREAVMNKFGESYTVTYICTACKTIWN